MYCVENFFQNLKGLLDKELDIFVQLEIWNDNPNYDRIGLDEKCSLLLVNLG